LYAATWPGCALSAGPGLGEPLHGLPDDFALLAEDIPDDPEDTEAGKDLPAEVMQQICEHLPSLADTKRNGNENRVAAELLTDTGRRPMEICQLRWDCLQQDASGQSALIYDNYKAPAKDAACRSPRPPQE
jgi:integrase